MRIELIKALKRNIEEFNYYCAKNLPGEAAKIFSVILESEGENLIDRTWRRDLNADQAELFIKQNNEKIVQEWEREFRQLKPILDYGGYMEYEEMSHILSLRSDLVSLSRFLPIDFLEKYKKPLELIDEDLVSVLKLNKEYIRDSRNSNRRYTGGLETYLPKHWWWRYDEGN